MQNVAECVVLHMPRRVTVPSTH